ncbi:MAG: translocation/assembly module TamB domain-containing protein, partial [Desulfobacterales bacterium]|nr:translocation/assembly module TamB domain-containing protein [Desulfobacterales bacterium]
GQDDTDRIKVTVGKALSERMTVKYETESKSGEMLQRAIAEYKLMENILLSGFQDSKGFFGGEFKFRLEFR